MQKSLRPTNSSITKAKTASVDKNRITSEAELKALLDEHRKTRVIGSDGEPITTLADKRKVLSAESTVTPDGLYPYVMLGSKMSYALFIEDYLKVSDANAPIKENFEAAVSLINPVRKVKKGEEVLENVRNWEKVIEETYDLANNSKKAKDAKTTQKEIDQLGEYVKKHDKGKDTLLDNDLAKMYKDVQQGIGSTGRTIPNTLDEQLAMKQVLSNPLEGAKDLSDYIKMSDKGRWEAKDGWIKMSNNVNGNEIHFVYNTVTGKFDDFKFK
ncbi:hypothetical protein MKX57_15310 [Lysinibacillus sp. FSL M8-0216]|uniref:hypothetical protein n=1 Tax=Lysinibacillus TaxID=400634 RepID=UPI00116F37BD|nr:MULTISPECIES: hypothetical protein [Lysinibacillus]MED4670332.1 hypothetical protein [Lysinibacillus fusiformis]GED66266.1 hypothetical protein LFU01_47180 [Lysinibacillus fusiformis]